jgi:hypothetical protein
MLSRASSQSLVEALLTEHKVMPLDMHEEMRLRTEQRERVAAERNVDELVIHLVHRRAAPEQQVATQFKLEDRILIGKAASLAVHVGERKAQTGMVDPPLAELA